MNPSSSVATSHSTRTATTAKTSVASAAETAMASAASVPPATCIRGNSKEGNQGNRDTNNNQKKFPFHFIPPV
jgi:hypothetical protein